MNEKGPPPPYDPSQPPPMGFAPPPNFQQPQPQAPFQQAPPATTVIVNVPGYGPYPQQTTCQNCSANVMTETTASPGLLTWILSGTCLVIGCWLGCCLIPCCIPECQDIEHRCPNCKTHLGTYRRI